MSALVANKLHHKVHELIELISGMNAAPKKGSPGEYTFSDVFCVCSSLFVICVVPCVMLLIVCVELRCV